MDHTTLEALLRRISEYFRVKKMTDRVTLYWHGGEPLLAGQSFFEKSFKLQQQYSTPNIRVTNMIQTNGILLNSKWIDFINKIGYGICLSLDGPPDIHDAWRLTKSGKGTYNLVVKAISLLKEKGFPISVLSVITPEALSYGKRIYLHLRELGITWMDFMYPFYSRIDNTLDLGIDPSKWGQFYVDIFDAWMNEGNPDIYIRLLRDLCMLYLGGKTSMCSSNSDCSYVITVDPTGNVYTCDDLLSYTDSYLGNILNDSLLDISTNSRLKKLSDISILYGQECLKCAYFSICKGGCTLFRARAFGDFQERHFFCQAQQRIIDHIKSYFGRIPIKQHI